MADPIATFEQCDARLWFEMAALVCAMPAGHKGWHCDATDREWTTVDGREPGAPEEPSSASRQLGTRWRCLVADGVTQTILYDPALNEIGVYGNCMQAAVATFFGLPLDAVPHFVAFEDWEAALRLWLKGIGWTVTFSARDTWPQARALVTGPSPRGVSHIVVGEHGRLAWDPHPSRDGVTEVRFVWWFERLTPEAAPSSDSEPAHDHATQAGDHHEDGGR